MGKVTYVQFDSTRRTIELEDGASLMSGAVAHGVHGIDGDCGGNCACATCHVKVDETWRAAAGPPASETEAELLELAPEAGPASRLACQIRMRAELDGIVVHLPEAQH
jgi:2Fe-2S ferredoxin